MHCDLVNIVSCTRDTIFEQFCPQGHWFVSPKKRQRDRIFDKVWCDLGSNKTSRTVELVSISDSHLWSMSEESEIMSGTRSAGKSQRKKKARGNKDSDKILFCKMNMSAVEARVTHTLLFN